MKVIYVSHPYSASSPAKIRANVHSAAELSAKLIEHGWATLNPDGNSHSVARYITRHHDDWIAMDLALLAKCDAIIMASGWQNSEGCRREHSYALSKHIPVYYEDNGVPWPNTP